MSPVEFLQQPLRWLKAISRYKATTSGGPNFAYDLCVHKITPEQRQGLDLSSWSLAFNGAEYIRAQTLDRFAATFAACGFRREAFYPCYGMAESTLFVSGGGKKSPPIVSQVEAGGAYVPLDPDYPDERLSFMLSDAQVSVLLTQQHLVAGLPKHEAVVCLDSD